MPSLSARIPDREVQADTKRALLIATIRERVTALHLLGDHTLAQQCQGLMRINMAGKIAPMRTLHLDARESILCTA